MAHDLSSPEVSRRDFLASGGAVLAAGAVLAVPGMVRAQTPTPGMVPPASTTPASPGLFQPKPLPFDPQKIRGFSEKILRSHHDNNYVSAVKRLGAIEAEFSTLDWKTAPVFTINGLKHEALIANNSMILHELYFAGLGGAPGEQPKAALAQALARDFGNYERWRDQFMGMGRALGGGSGWVLLTYDPHNQRLVNTWAADHSMTLAGGTPILALDMYEHAYQMDYGAKATAYIDAFMDTIRWDNPSRLYERFARQQG